MRFRVCNFNCVLDGGLGVYRKSLCGGFSGRFFRGICVLSSLLCAMGVTVPKPEQSRGEVCRAIAARVRRA